MASSTDAAPRITFAPPGGLHAELRTRVDEHFARTGRARRGGFSLQAKAVVMVMWLVLSYVFLVFVAATWWQALLGVVSLALAVAGVGFNVQHDANHGAFSERRWLTHLAGLSLDLVGASSYVWRFQHNVLHHVYPNVAGTDFDIEAGDIVRLSPAQRWQPVHRFQHVYFWLLSSLVPLKWAVWGDWAHVRTGRVGRHPLPTPSRRDLTELVTGKVIMYVLAFVVPLLVHPWYTALAGGLAALLLLGVLLVTVFSLAHLSDEADHPLSTEGALADEWAVFQVETTVDFCQRNRLLTWYLGGLNFQIEHHLFPRVAHTHYPALAPIVREVAERHGVRYVAHPTLAAAVTSRQRFLRRMGRPPTESD